MTRLLRILLKAVLWALGALGVLALAIVAINAFDEDLSPQTVALLKPPANPYAPDENLYIALVGFDAPEGQSVVTVGQARIAENEVATRNVLKNPETFSESMERYENQERLAFRGNPDFCRLLEGSCWTAVDSHRREINTLLEDNQELYRRYLALHSLRGYFETQNSYFLSGASPPAQARAVFLTNIALRIKTGKTAQDKNAALLELRDDVETWRRMLVGNGGLMSKVIALVSLHGDYVFLGDMISDPSIDLVPLSAGVEDILARVAADDWKLHHTFVNDFRASAVLFERLRSSKTDFPRLFRPRYPPPEWWEPYWGQIQGYFLKVNATQNINARAMIEVQKMVETDPRQLLTAQGRLFIWDEGNLGFGPSYIYNPTGKLLVATRASSYDDWPLRFYDVAAYARADRLAYEIRKQRIAASDIPAFSRQHPEWATHPVSGELFVWDPEARQLRIPTMERPARPERRFNIPVSTRTGL